MAEQEPIISINFNDKKFDEINTLIDSLQVTSKRDVYFRAMVIATAKVEKKLKENISGPMLNVRTGLLRHSMGSKVQWEGNEFVGTVGSGVRNNKRLVYADILETGGIIRPKKAKYLAIPIGEGRTKSGVARGKPRDFTNTFIQGGIIWQRVTKERVSKKTGNKTIKETARPLFILKKAVTIPAFRYMSKTADEMADIAMGSIIQAVEEIQKKNKGQDNE